MLKLGVQVSVEGGIEKSIDRALALQCNTMQIFVRNPRRFRKGFLKDDEIDMFKKKFLKSGISPLVVHTPYTLNLASSKVFLHWITVKEFILDLLEVDKLGADYLVTHTGCYKGANEEAGLKKVVKALKKILKSTEGIKTNILLENTSGGGTWLGYKFFHYNFILKELNYTDRVGVCLDTAHAWNAGYRINSEIGLEEMLSEIKQTIGIHRVKLVHLNDTLDELGSRKDKHSHIGEGKIGEKGFSLIVNHPLLRDLPFILETPKKDESDDIKNLNTVRRIYRNELH
ncbi:MAG: deoxyribonuclease IV [Candidatus Omnitrophica bacterium]|nr:deoxyribonuclease IV [Candidatus Omnitrophota bacterium]